MFLDRKKNARGENRAKEVEAKKAPTSKTIGPGIGEAHSHDPNRSYMSTRSGSVKPGSYFER